MLYALQGVKLNAHCYTRSEDFMLINLHRVKLMLIAILRVKRDAHCYTRSEALCSLLYME